MTTPFSFPYTISQNTPATAVEVQGNFDALLAWILQYYRQLDDTPKLTVQMDLPGSPTTSTQAVNKGYADLLVPIGMIAPYGGATPPDEWVLCDGSTYTDGTYPSLSGVLGRAYTDAGVPAGSFSVPDLRTRVPVGRSAGDSLFDALGDTGGSKDLVVPIHAHQQQTHVHGFTTDTDGTHVHDNSANQQGDGFAERGGGTEWGFPLDSNEALFAYRDQPASQATGSAHAHSGTTNPAGDDTTADAGQDPADKNVPPFVTINYIIRSGATGA